MEISFNIMKDENVNEECSSFCSSCNSFLHSICSVGVPSFFELNNENVIDNSDALNEVANEHILNSHIKEKAYVKNSCANVNLIKPRTYEDEKVNEQVGCSINKKIKYVKSLSEVNTDSLKIISKQRLNSKNNSRDNIRSEKITINQSTKENENYATLSSVVKCETYMFITPTWDNLPNRKGLETKILKYTKKDALSKVVPFINDGLDSFPTRNLSLTKLQSKTNYSIRNILNYRKKILKTIKSILFLCKYMNIIRETILREIYKKQYIQRC